MTRIPIIILGSTGSVGGAALKVAAAHPDRFTVAALTACQNVKRLAEQAKRFRPRRVVIGDPALYENLKARLADTEIDIAAGEKALNDAAAMKEDGRATVVAAISGIAGLSSLLTAARAGQKIALANKESVVAAGELLIKEARKGGAEIIPVDSEHSALFRLMRREKISSIRRVILTASGGPFLRASASRIAAATPEDAANHPIWRMGRKISVDSATMMNKGLELIEAHYLFDLPESKIDVLLHPQSVVHAMMETEDGALHAHIEPPDMGIPLAYALFYPDSPPAPQHSADFLMGDMRFEPLDQKRFPAIEIARQALRKGGSAATILNAANEAAVGAFLRGAIGFADIIRVVEGTLSSMETSVMSFLPSSLEAVMDVNSRARRAAKRRMKMVDAA